MRGIRAKDNYEKEILTRIESLSRSRQTWQVWSDLICAMACTLSNSCDKDPELWKEREKEYVSCIKRLGGAELPAEIFRLIIEALETNPWQDLLGDLYMRLNLGSHWHGQFFTPFNLCRLMASISIDQKPAEQIREHGWVSVSDPSVGGGATLIAAAEEFRRQDINYQTQVLFVGQDVDRVAGLMAYIQLSLLGCPGYIVIGNTLTNPVTGFSVLRPCPKEGQEFWFTPFFFRHEWQGRLLCEKMDELMKGSRKKEKLIFYFNFEKEEGDVRESIRKAGIAI